MSNISIDLGSIYSSLNLRLDRFDTTINTAVQGFYRLQLGTERASNIMDRSVNTAVSNIARSYELWERANERTGRNIFDNSRQIESLRDQIRLLDEEIRRSDEILHNIETQFGRNSQEAETYRARVLELRSSQANLTEEMRRAERQTGTFRGRLQLLGQEFQRIDERYQVFDKIGDKFQAAGSKLTMGVTVPAIGAGTAMTKFAFDFEKGAAKVSTIADTTKVPIEDLKKGVIDLSNKTGMSTKELNESLYQAISGSVDTAKAVDFLDVAVKAAKGGFTETSVAVDGLTTVLNSYGLEADKATDISNQMLVCQNLGKTTFGELASAVGKVTPIAASLGVTTNELFSSLASTTAQGLATAESVTALKAAMSNIIKPSKEAGDAAEQLGIDFSVSAVKSKGWIGFLKDVKKGLEKASPEFARISSLSAKVAERLASLEQQGKKNTDEYKKLKKESKNLSKEFESLAKMSDSPIGAFAQMFGSVEGLNSILMLTSDQGLAKYNDAMKEMKTNTHALDDAYKKMSETTEAKFNKAMNKAKNSLMELGIKALPVVEKGINLISKLTDKFNSLSPSMQENIIKIGLASAALGPFMSVVGGTFKTVNTLWKLGPKINTFFGLFRGASTAATAVSSIGTAATVATGTAGAAGGGILGLASSFGTAALAAAPWIAAAGAVAYGGYKVYKHMTKEAVPAVDLFADSVQKTTNSIKTSNGQIISSYGQTTVKISGETKKAVGSYMELDKKASNSLMELRANSNKFTQDAKNKVLKNFTDMSKSSDKIGSEIKNNMTTDFKNLVNTTGVLTDKNKKDILSKYTDMVNGCSKLTSKQKQDIISNFNTILQQSTAITNKQKQNLTSIYSQMGNQIKIGIDKKKQEELNSLQDFFSKSNALTTKEEADILNKTSKTWDDKKKTIDGYQKQIDSIVENASKNHRQVTNEEAKQIDSIRKKMATNAVKVLSNSEVESKAILEKIKSNDERITAEQASSHIKQLNKLRDDSVKAANDECDKRIKEIIRLRDESKLISADQAEKLIADAKKQKEESIKHAEETRKECVEKITDMDSTISKDVDTTTGEIRDNWQKMKYEWDNWNPKEHNCVVNFFHNIFTNDKKNNDTLPVRTEEEMKEDFQRSKRHYATGTDNAERGWNEVAEDGFEIVSSRQYRWFNGGEKVFNHADSKKLLSALFENKSNPQNIAKEALAQSKEIIGIKPRIGISESTIKSNSNNMLNWGANNKKAYEEFLYFKDKLNKEEVEKSKEYLREEYDNRVKNLEDRLKILKNENSIELQTEKARIDAEIAYYQKLQRNTKDKKAKVNYANEINNLRQYQKQVLNATKTNQKAQIDSLEKSRQALKDYYDDGMKLLNKKEEEIKKSLKTEENIFKNTINEYNESIKRLSINTKDLNQNLLNNQAIVILQEEKIKELKKGYEELASTFGYTAEETINAKKAFEEAKTELISMGEAVNDAKQKIIDTQIQVDKNFSDSINNMVIKIKNALKQRYDDELKAQESHINNELKNLDRWKNESINRIESVYDAKIKAIDEQLIEEEKADKDAEEEKKISQLQAAIEYEHNEFNKNEIQKELNTLIKERDKRLHKEQLQEQKKKLQQQKENELKNINAIYESNKQSLEKQLEDYRNFYAIRTRDAEIQAEAERMIMQNNQEEIVKLLHSYEEAYEQAGQSLGERLILGFKPKIDELKSMLESIQESFEDARSSALSAMAAKNAAINSTPISKSSSRTINDNRKHIVNNNRFTFNSPQALNYSEERRKTETMLRRIDFTMA